MNVKLDAVASAVTQGSIRLQDVQERLHRIENLQDANRQQVQTAGDVRDFAKK